MRAGLVTVQLLFGINYLVSKQVVDVLDPAAWATLRVVSATAILGLLLLSEPVTWRLVVAGLLVLVSLAMREGPAPTRRRA